MKVLPNVFEFEWDKWNADKNQMKHGVSKKEAEEPFENDQKFIFKDEQHSQTEERFGLFGMTEEGRTLSIVFTIRQGKVRIITARDMSRKERRTYEEKAKIDTKI